jgi:hypothetical protein
MNKNKLSADEINIYSSINDFVNDTCEYLEKNKITIQSIINYNELLKQTTFSNKISIRKHIMAFEIFIEKNKPYINGGGKIIDITTTPSIRYSNSKNIFINIVELLNACDSTNQKLIYDHIVNIHNKIFPASSINLSKEKSFTMPLSMPPNMSLDNMAPVMMAAMNNPDIMNMVNTMANQVNENETDPMKIAMSVIASPALPSMINQISKMADDGKLNNVLSAFGLNHKKR